jgi:hypothetical protein
MGLSLTQLSSSLFNQFITADMMDEVFTLTFEDPQMKGVVNIPFNFTVSIENVVWREETLEVII